MLAKVLDRLSKLSLRQILILTGAVGVVIFGLVYSTLSSIASEVDGKIDEPTMQVVTAAVDIPARSVINESMLTLKTLPENVVPIGAFKNISDVIGKSARSEIFSGDILTDKKIFNGVEEMGLIAMIPADCRAVSVAVSDITSYFAKPGDYVDVMLAADNQTEIILQNVLLLAIGENSTATLALKSDDAMKIVNAVRRGTLYLALRPVSPINPVIAKTHYEIETNEPPPQDDYQPSYNITVPVTLPEIEINNPAPIYQPPPATYEPPEDNGIEIILGDKIVSK